MDSLLKRIKDMRESQGWSEYKLAEKCDLQQSTISSWYRDQSYPSVQSLRKIADGFGISLSLLIAEGNTVEVGEREKELLHRWSMLDESKRVVLLQFLGAFIEK